jgi:O-antigen ligase
MVKKIRLHWFNYALAFFPALFPLYLMRGTILGIPSTVPELVLGVLFLFFFFKERVWSLLFWRIHARRLFPLPVLIFIGAVILSLASHYPPNLEMLGILKGWILAPLLYFGMMRVVFYEKPSLIRVAVLSMLLGGVVLSFMALNQVFTGEFLTADGRASGPFESANYLSLYLGPLLVYSFLSAFQSQNSRERWAFALIALVLGAALYFSFSYAAWIAVFTAGSLAFLNWCHGQSKLWFWRGILGLGILGFLLVLSQMGTDKFQQFFEFSERSSSSVRLEVYQIAFAMIRENPLFGIGLGAFDSLYSAMASRVLGHAPFEWVMIHPHNVFLAFWINLGLLGLVSVGLFIWKSAIWLKEKSRHGQGLVFFMLLTTLIHGFFDTPVFKNDLAFQFWLFLAILL